MKGPTGGPVRGGQTPAASDALPDPLAPTQGLPGLTSIVLSCYDPGLAEGAFWSLTGRTTDGQLSWDRVPIWARGGALLPHKMSWGQTKNPVTPVHAGDSRVAWQAWSFSRVDPDISSPALFPSAQVNGPLMGSRPTV